MYWSLGKWISLSIENEVAEFTLCSKPHSEDYCNVTLQICWFELNWWCLGTAGYGAVEFRWNRWWC